MTTDELMSRDPATPPHGTPAYPADDAPGLFAYAWTDAGPRTGAPQRPDWIDAPDPTDPFAYRDLPAWATEPTSVHQPCPQPSDVPEAHDPQDVPDPPDVDPPYRDALARLRDAGPPGATLVRQQGWAAGQAYAAAVADHAAGLPLPAATAVRPPHPAAVLPPDAEPVAQPSPASVDPSVLVGRHRSGEPPSRRTRFRGIAAVLPWNWRRR